MTDELAVEMWRGDMLAGKIVSLLPKEGLEPGVALTVQDEKNMRSGASDTRNAGDLVEDVERYHRDLGTEKMIVKACVWERLFGGSAIWAGANDYQAGSWAQPINLESPKMAIRWLDVLRSRDLTPVSRYTDPLHPKFGQVEVWRLSRTIGGGTLYQQAEIHESRLFLFRGRRIVDDGTVITQNLQSTEFGDGILLAVQGALRRFQESLDNTELAMRANGELLWQHNRLSEVLANEGDEDFRRLVSAMNYASSILRARVVGADQTLTRQSISLAGLADIVTKFENELAAISDTPRTKLFGDVPGGLGNNATGPHGDWDETKGVYRKENQLPAYEWVTKLIFRSLGGEPRRWKLEGNPYRHPTQTEQGALVKLEADTDIALASAGLVTAEEVRTRTIWRDRYALPDPDALPELGEMPEDIRSPEGEVPGGQLEATAPEEPRLAEAALNGAQALAISAIAEKVAAGILPRESAVAQLMYSFKAPREAAEQMVPQEGFRPRAVESGIVAPPTESTPPRTDSRGDAIDTGATVRFTYAPLPAEIVHAMEKIQSEVMPDGAVAQEIDHVTLVYCPKAAADIPQPKILETVAALRAATNGASPIAAKVQGWAYFDGARKDGEDKTALVALIDAPGITKLQVRLQDALAAAGMEPSRDHSFSPHFTICYLEPGERVDDLPLISAEFTIDRVLFANREVHEIILADEERIDCENPIRGEDGMFDGCAPGEGSGSSSPDPGFGPLPARQKPTASKANSAPKTKAAPTPVKPVEAPTVPERPRLQPVIWVDGKAVPPAWLLPPATTSAKETPEERIARVARIKDRVKVPVAKSAEHAAAAENHREYLLRNVNDEMAMGMSGISVEKEEEILRLDVRNWQSQIDAIASGDVRPPVREQLDRYIDRDRPAIDKKLADAADELGKSHTDAANELAVLKGYDGDDLPAIDHEDIENSFQDLYDEADISDRYALPDGPPEDAIIPNLDDEPDSDDPASDYNPAAQEYNELAQKRIDGQRAAAERARDALVKLQVQQEELVSRMKEVEKENSKFSKRIEKEKIDPDDEDKLRELLDPGVAAIGKAIDDGNGDTVTDEEENRYGDAIHAAELMVDFDFEDLTSLSIPYDGIKTAKAATKKMIRVLDRFLAKPAPKPKLLDLKDDDSDSDLEDGDE